MSELDTSEPGADLHQQARERLEKTSDGLRLDRLNRGLPGVGGRRGVTLKKGDLVAWPVVLLKRPLD